MSFPLAFIRSFYPVVPRKRLHCLPLSIWPECRTDRWTDEHVAYDCDVRIAALVARSLARSFTHSLIPIRDRVSKIYCRSGEHKRKGFSAAE